MQTAGWFKRMESTCCKKAKVWIIRILHMSKGAIGFHEVRNAAYAAFLVYYINCSKHDNSYKNAYNPAEKANKADYQCYNMYISLTWAVNLLKLTAEYIENMSEHKQIADCVDKITANINEYKMNSDLKTLEKLRDLCIKEDMKIEMAKMYRNVGMYYFHADNINKAIIAMQLSIDILSHRGCIGLLARFYSELGLMYFYNHEYIYSKRYNEETEELLKQEPEADSKTLYLHYLRYGVLLSNMQDYEASRAKLESALNYARDNRDEALAVMNIGLLYKRQRDLKTALRYYAKALCLVDSVDTKAKCMVYNNIAEVYKILGQYEKALCYIEKAFGCIADNDMSRLFVCFNTYTEIKILMGDKESVLDEFLTLLVRVEDFHLYKGFIIEGIQNMITIGNEDERILSRLEDAIVKLIEDNKYENDEYIRELKVCMGNIRLFLREIKKEEEKTKNPGTAT